MIFSKNEKTNPMKRFTQYHTLFAPVHFVKRRPFNNNNNNNNDDNENSNCYERYTIRRRNEFPLCRVLKQIYTPDEV